MKKHHPENERIKHRYAGYLRDACRKSEPSIDKALAAIAAFERYTGWKPFNAFHIRQASGFKRHLTEQRAERSGQPLSAATMHATLAALKAFFTWLAYQQGYRRRINVSDADYFNISDKEKAVATAKREQPVPTIVQILHVLRSMPATSEIERRDRALIAFVLLSGARDDAVASMKVKHVDAIAGTVTQDARQVRTKASKTFTTDFFPVGDEVREIVVDWIRHLREDKNWGDDDPLFPATKVEVGATRRFEVSGLDRVNWRTATPIRKVFQRAFEAAGLPYFNPHSFRSTLARLGEQRCKTPEQFKSWSQNLGHEQVLTTLRSYGAVDRRRQAEIMRELAAPAEDQDVLIESLAETLEKLRRK